MTKEHEIGFFLQRLKVFGISEEDFRRTDKQITDRWGYETTAEDTYLVILNQLAGKHSSEPYMVARVFFHIRDHCRCSYIDPLELNKSAQVEKLLSP